MRRQDALARIAIGGGALALILSFGASLALLDIVQGKEPDLSLEWAVVWLALPVVVLAVIVLMAAVVALRRTDTRAARN